MGGKAIRLRGAAPAPARTSWWGPPRADSARTCGDDRHREASTPLPGPSSPPSVRTAPGTPRPVPAAGSVSRETHLSGHGRGMPRDVSRETPIPHLQAIDHVKHLLTGARSTRDAGVPYWGQRRPTHRSPGSWAGPKRRRERHPPAIRGLTTPEGTPGEPAQRPSGGSPRDSRGATRGNPGEEGWAHPTRSEHPRPHRAPGGPRGDDRRWTHPPVGGRR